MPWPSETNRDTAIFDLLDAERTRQSTGLQLIASENFTSPDVMAATGSVLTNKYSEGYPSKRYYGGNAVVDEIEALAIERVKKLFGADHANVQPHSGASANMAVYLGLLNPGDTVLGLSLDHGGHLTHGSPVNASGIMYNFHSFKVGATDERLNFDEIRELAIAHKPKMIVAGTTSYPRRLEPEPFKKIADEVGALMMFDIAHIAGLVAGGAHPNPVPFADVVTFTTHKTLRDHVEDAFFVAKNLRQLLTRRFFRAAKAGHLSMQLLPKPWRFKKRCNRAFAITRIKLSRMHRHLPPHLPVTVSDSSQVAPTLT